jgi:DNA-directed RNA polymerase specialized sigma24 family protein
MAGEKMMPAAALRVSDEKAAEIVRLDVRGLCHAEIAKRVKVHRQTVERVLARTRALQRVT